MSDPMVAVLMLGVLLTCIFLGFPIAFTLMALAIGFGYYAYFEPARMDHLFDNRIFDLFVNQTYTVMSNDVLTAVPLFLFMGYIVERANIVDRLFKSIFISMRAVPGALAVAALITCTLFATATGIVGAVVTLMGLLALPPMLKARYNIPYATGVIAAGGTLGILIPPSILLILYAATASVSAVRMYAAALIPGFMLAGMYLLYVITRAVINPKLAPKPSVEDLGDMGQATLAQTAWMLLTSFVPLALLIVAVLGAILGGLATPSEAAAIGAMGGILLAAAYRTLSWERLRESVYLTVRTTAMVAWLFVGSNSFASVFAYLGGQQVVTNFVTGLDLSPVLFMVVTQIIIFILGWPLEWTEIIVIFIPIFLPLLPHFGVDPVFFGIIVALNLQTAFLSPPMAMPAFYLKGIAPSYVQITQIFRGMLPYLFIVILAMILIYNFPQIAFWLPDTLYGTAGTGRM